MRRVIVIGVSCSGKSTLARMLADRLDVAYVELDALHHDPGWQEAPAELLRDRVLAALAASPNGWVVDGNYFGKLGALLLERADTVVMLDLPLRVLLLRALRRTVSRLVRRTELWNGNRERLRNVFSRHSIPLWVFRAHRGFRTTWDARIGAHPALAVVRLRTPREVAVWAQSIQAIATTSGSSNGSERQKTPPFTET